MSVDSSRHRRRRRFAHKPLAEISTSPPKRALALRAEKGASIALDKAVSPITRYLLLAPIAPLKVWLFALFLAVLTSLPYLVGTLNTPQGWAYNGAPAIPEGTRIDYYVYIAGMWEGKSGRWDYRMPFTHEPHIGIPLVHTLYTAMGALASLTPFSLPLFYHIIRFSLTTSMALALWAFGGRFFSEARDRWWFMLFATVVGGWSWLLLFFAPGMTTQVSPIEFWLTDAFHLLGATYSPHFAASILLQIVIVLTFESWIEKGGIHFLVILTLALAVESSTQPYIVFLLEPLLGMLAAYHLLISRRLTLRRALALAIPFGVHTALIGYLYLALNSDPLWQNFVQQNPTLSPDIAYYIFGYLPFILPIAFGARRFLLDRADDRWLMPVLWVMLVAVLVYIPFQTQRRFLLGVQTPLAALAAYGWTRAVLPRLSSPRIKVLLAVAYMLFSGTALAAMLLMNALALANPRRSKDVFYTPDELAAMAWLQRERDSRDDVVLTTFDPAGGGSGGRLAAATGQQVFLGHWIETAHYKAKVEQVKQFYDSATSDDWRRAFLRDSRIAYVWYDDYARAQGGWNPASAAYLEAVFVNETVTIYKVDRVPSIELSLLYPQQRRLSYSDTLKSPGVTSLTAASSFSVFRGRCRGCWSGSVHTTSAKKRSMRRK